MITVMGRKLLGDLMDPLVELALGARVQRREAADDPRLALRDDEVGIRHDEQRRADGGQAQAIEDRWQAHAMLW